MLLSLNDRLRSPCLVAAAIGVALVAGCSSDKSPAAPTVTVSSVAITGTGATAIVGQTAALVATATFSNGTTSNVTAQATWESSNTTVATVSPAGVVAFLAAGSVDVRATYRSVIASASVAVAAPNFVGAGDVDFRATLSGVTGSLRVAVTAQPTFRNIDGIVRDAVSDQPIADVLVQVRGGANDGRSTRTNANGDYTLSNLLTGSFTLEFTGGGLYSPASRDLTLSDDTRVDVGLNPNVGTYYGRMNIDGTLSGSLPAGTLFPGAVRPLHEVSATMQGKVTGNAVTGAEFMIYTVGCQPGAIINLSLSGSR